MNERLSKAEIRKDAVQDAVQAAAGAVGQVSTIVTGAVKDVAGVVGGFATELFEIRDAARRADADQERPADPGLHFDPDAIARVSPDVHPDPDAPTP
jgi:hypothetical protein